MLCAFLILALVAAPIPFQRHQSDRESYGLKGHVKTVSISKAKLKDVSGRQSERKRVLNEEDTFDSEGRQLTVKNFDEDGDLFSFMKYSYIAEGKIANIQPVKNKNIIEGVVIASESGKKPAGPRDLRFDYRYKYSYDNNGDIIEEIMYLNDGSLWTRSVYSETKNRREQLLYSINNKLMQRNVYILDDKGNETEMISYESLTDTSGAGETYKYIDFDKEGNWTKRIVSRPGEADTKTLKPAVVEYRTITYF